MADLLKTAASFLMSEKCYDNYILEHNFLDVPCFKALLSKGLGVGIITGSLLVKIPQVLKIYNNKSSEGINLISVLLDLTAITFHMSYNYVKGYPFSAWGDNTFLALQTALIAALVLHYSGAYAKTSLFCGLYAIAVYVLCSGLTPLTVLLAAQKVNIPILLVGKLSQAWTNYMNGSTGQLSAATMFLLFAGSLARIFTSVQETGDSMMVTTFCTSTFANGIIAAQVLYYWNKNKASKRDSVKKTVSAKTVRRGRSKKAD